MSELAVRPFQGSPARWDRMVEESLYPSFFQSWGWGEFKNYQGWSPCRLLINDSTGTELAGCQILLRRPLPWFTFVWIPGGPFPIGNSFLSREILQALTKHLRNLFFWPYVRIYLMRPAEPVLEEHLAAYMRKSPILLNSGRSILLDLKSNESEFLQGMTGKHRYTVRQAQKHSLRWESEINSELIQKFSDLMTQMGQIKGKKHLSISTQTLEKLVETCTANVRILVGFAEGQPVTGSIVLTQGIRSWYLYAASNHLGRKLGASYAMIMVMAGSLRRDKIFELDFGGLGPEDPSFAGTNHFKKGFGGQILTYAGEWEYGNFVACTFGNLSVILKK